MAFEHIFLKIQDFFDNFIEKYIRRGKLKNHIILKYLLKDLFLYFLVAFLFFFMIFFVNQILLTVENLLAKSAPLQDVVRIMVYSLPTIIAQSAPYATLVGFLMSLGGMMSSNEVLIFRSAGFSFFRILQPVLILGLLISIASFFVNDYLLPLGTKKYNQLFRKIMQSTPTVELESNSAKQMGDTMVVMGEVNEGLVSDIILFDSDGKSDRIIVAGESSLTGARQEGVLMQLNMQDAIITSIQTSDRSDYDVMQSENATLNIFDSSVLNTNSHSAREMTTTDVAKEIKKMKENLGDQKSSRLNIWRMEFWKKFSVPFGALFFSFLAMTVAFLFGKKNGQTIGLFVGIVICVLSWAMQIMGQLFVQKLGWNPFWSIWIPNLVVGFVGAFFYLILIRK
jgi:lipopolysaccharide export system permease protein